MLAAAAPVDLSVRKTIFRREFHRNTTSFTGFPSIAFLLTPAAYIPADGEALTQKAFSESMGSYGIL